MRKQEAVTGEYVPKTFCELGSAYKNKVLKAFMHLLMPDGTSVMQLAILQKMKPNDRTATWSQDWDTACTCAGALQSCLETNSMHCC